MFVAVSSVQGSGTAGACVSSPEGCRRATVWPSVQKLPEEMSPIIGLRPLPVQSPGPHSKANLGVLASPSGS